MTRNLETSVSPTPDQFRMARAGLNITIRDLAALTNVNKATIVRIEAGFSVRPATSAAIRDVLIGMGATFLEDAQGEAVFVGLRKSN